MRGLHTGVRRRNGRGLKALAIGVLVCICIQGGLRGEVRSAHDYVIQTETRVQAGDRVRSADYTIDASVGGVTGTSSALSPLQIAKHGYAGQLYDLVAIELSAVPTNVLEYQTLQVHASGVFDDDSVGQFCATPTWSVISGPLQGVSQLGLVYADRTFMDAGAVVGVVADGVSGQIGILVLDDPSLNPFVNVTPTRYGRLYGMGAELFDRNAFWGRTVLQQKYLGSGSFRAVSLSRSTHIPTSTAQS